MNWKALAVATLLVVSSVGATMAVSAGTASTQSAEAYSGTHVSFETTGDAVTGYTVNNNTVVDSLKVQSTEQARANGNVGASVDLGAVTELAGSAVTVESRAGTNATLRTESGATMTAHDNDRGILVVAAGNSGQVVHANVSANAAASAESDKQVVVERDDGTTGTFLVVGEGEVAVNERGNVTADLGQDGKLVYRQYEGERSDSEKQQEALITSGTAAAEVYVQSAAGSGDDASDEGEQRAVDVVRYSEDTTVEVTSTTESTVEMTAERSESEGRVIITTVSEEVVGSAEDVNVTVDGEAAVRAESYSEVRSATEGGETSKFVARSSSSAEASTDVVVGVNHFSKRSIAVQDGSSDGDDSGSDPDGDADGDQQTPDGDSSGDGAGFGVTVAVAALVGAALLARRRT